MKAHPGDAAAEEPARHLSFERCLNFRDLGGYAGWDGRRLRWRRLFRSMTPEYMTERDLCLARQLDIGLVIDLRGPRFVTSGPLGEPPARRVVLGRRRGWRRSQEERRRLIEAPPEVALPAYLERMAPSFVRAVRVMPGAPGAVLVHCRLGKDRTGILSAVLLKLVGVADADVIADYMASAPFTAPALQLVREAERNNPEDQIHTESRVSNEPPKPEAMEAVLARLEELGGARRFLEERGASPRTLDRLVKKLLEDGYRAE